MHGKEHWFCCGNVKDDDDDDDSDFIFYKITKAGHAVSEKRTRTRQSRVLPGALYILPGISGM